MQDLLTYLYKQFISEQSELSIALLKLQPIKFLHTKILYSSQGVHEKLITQNNYQIMQYLLAKNYISYSPLNLEIKLNVVNIMFYQRVHKLQDFASKYLEAVFADAFHKFIDNQLLPFTYDRKKVQKLMDIEPKHQPSKIVIEGKGKKKKQIIKQQVIHVPVQHKSSYHNFDYSRLIYQYSSQIKKQQQKTQIEYLINIQQLTDLLRFSIVERIIEKRKTEMLNVCKGSLKQGQQNLKSLSYLQLYQTIKQNRPKHKFINQIIQKSKYQKMQEYLMQLFRRYDIEPQKEEEEDNEKQILQKKHLGQLNHSRNVLLVFNLIKLYPYITQKQLLNQSLLHVLQLRKCLNLLISQGIINYYQQNIRTTLYKTIEYKQLQNRYVNHIAKSILNIYTAMNTPNIKNEQLLRFECMLNQLDDILLLFGY